MGCQNEDLESRHMTTFARQLEEAPSSLEWPLDRVLTNRAGCAK